MIRLQWMIAQALARFGWQGIGGIALIVASAAFYASMLAPLDNRIAKHRAGAMASHSANANSAQMRDQDPATQLSVFYRHFDRDTPPTEWLAKFYGIAESNGLSLRQAEYRMGEISTGHLAQYQVVIPVTGTYPQLKRFVATVLAEVPIASLDQFSMQRRKIGDRTVDAQLQFTFFVPVKS